MKTLLKTISLFVCVMFAMQSQAQTKEKTIKWLTEKMMKPCFLYNSPDGSISTIKAVKFNNNLLEYTIEYKNKLHSEQVNLDKVKQIDETGWLKTDGDYVYYIFEDGQRLSVETAFQINPNCERNLIPDFQKKLNHYISLLTAKK